MFTAESDRGASGAAAVRDDVRSEAEARLAEGEPAWPFCVVGPGSAAGAAGESDPLVGSGSTGGCGAVSSGKSLGAPAALADGGVGFGAGSVAGGSAALALAEAGAAGSMGGIKSGLGPRS